MKTVLSLLALVFLTGPALAQGCLSPEGLLSLPTSDSVVVADLTVTGALFDREIIVHYQGVEFMWLFKDGCAIGDPVVIGADPSAPAATPQKAPVLHGGGQEIGT